MAMPHVYYASKHALCNQPRKAARGTSRDSLNWSNCPMYSAPARSPAWHHPIRSCVSGRSNFTVAATVFTPSGPSGLYLHTCHSSDSTRDLLGGRCAASAEAGQHAEPQAGPPRPCGGCEWCLTLSPAGPVPSMVVCVTNQRSYGDIALLTWGPLDSVAQVPFVQATYGVPRRPGRHCTNSKLHLPLLVRVCTHECRQAACPHTGSRVSDTA